MCDTFYKVLIVLTASIHLVSGDCAFRVYGEPLVVKDFGFKEVILPNTGTINFENGESLNVYCQTGITDCGNRYGTQVTIECKDGNSYIKEKARYVNCALECDLKSSIQLYESKQKLVNCEPHTSLAIGIHVSNVTSKVFAGICYDWNNLDLKFVKYMAYRSFSYVTTNDDFDIDVVTMDKQLLSYEKYFKFMSEQSWNFNYNSLQENNTMLNNFRFDYASIIQDRPITKDLEPHKNILNIIWWRNLRLGNWQTFLNLLEERSQTVKYNITTGTSGVVYIPSPVNSCQNNQTMQIVIENNVKKTAPAYVWTHLKALSYNETDDFVVIGYNSPFYSNEASIILCEDMCAKIDWLKKFGKVRLMPTMGLVFCCRPSDVVHKLDNYYWIAEEDVNANSTEYNEVLSTPNTTPYFGRN